MSQLKMVLRRSIKKRIKVMRQWRCPHPEGWGRCLLYWASIASNLWCNQASSVGDNSGHSIVFATVLSIVLSPN